MSSEAHTPHDGSLVPAGPESLKRARRERRTRRQRRAALAVAAVCALVLGEALAHVLEAWPDDGSSSRAARSAAPSRASDPGSEAPRPIDTPVVVDISDAPSLDRSVAAAPAVAPFAWEPSRHVGAQGAPGSAAALKQRAASDEQVSGAAPPAAVSPGAAPPRAEAQSAPSGIAVPSGGQPPRVPGAAGEGRAGQSPAEAPLASADADALRKAAAAALARERNINKVRVYPSRPVGHVNND